MRFFKYCLDSHPLIWYSAGQKTLSKKAKDILDEIFFQKIQCYIPSIVLLEIFHFSLKKKEFIFSKFLKKLALPNIIIVPFERVVLSRCFKLPKYLNIHDRIIAATAINNECALITRDSALKKVPDLKIVW